MVRQLASLLGAIVLVAACTRNEGEVAQTRAEGSTGGADGTQTEAAGSQEAGIAGRVVFDADWDIYVANADGSGLKQLTTSPAREFDPSWSPEGVKIAYRYQPGDDASAEIYVMGADGSEKTNLTRSPGQDHSPAWSPDGTKIAFASTRGGVLPHIWVMKIDGSNQTRLTAVSGEYPAWSPDGTQLAFDVNTDLEPTIDQGARAGFDIFVVRADGSGLRRLTRAAGNDQGASWSPDGRRIVFESDRGRSPGSTTLWTMKADGSMEKPLTSRDGFRPTWSRDDANILFSARGLFVVRADGSDLRALPIRAPGEIGLADWTG
jgi:TolB protein